MKKIIFLILIIAAIGAGSYFLYEFFISKKNEPEVAKKEIYTCPMHPQIQQDHPGVCPICNMELILKDVPAANLEEGVHPRTESGEIILSPAQQVLANVQTQKAMMEEVSGERIFNGYVKLDEKKLRHIATPVAGKVVNMSVNFEGQSVSIGQLIFQIYSPEILAAQKEYLLALENYDKSGNSEYSLVREQAHSLVNSARELLKRWELTPEQIEELGQTREASDFINVYSKYSGVVTKKIATEGHWANAGEDIYDIADMSTVWVIASVPQSEINFVRIGQSADITSVSYPGEEFFARVNFINPLLNSETRSMEVRLDVTNRSYKLKPEMFVSVAMKNSSQTRNLVVPRNAVLRTGKMDVVYVKKEGNIFAPKMVTIGGENNGNYIITSGLEEGEEVVTSAGFLIDSESQIRFSGNTMQNMEDMKMDKSEEPVFNDEHDILKDMKEKNLDQEHKH